MEVVEFITLQEFAERAGVSVQAVYSRFNKIDKAFVKVENGRKYISTSALELFAKHHSSTVERPLMGESDNLNKEQALQTQLESLKEQLEKAEKREEWLKNQLAEKDKQIERLQVTNSNLSFTNQFLLNQQNKDSTPAGSDTESKEESQTEPPAGQDSQPVEQAAPAPIEEKHGFFWRLFH